MWRRTKGAAPRGRARAVVAASDFRVAGEEVKELRGEVWGQCGAGTGRGNSDRSGWPPPGELAAGNRPVRLPPSGTRDFIKAGRGWMSGQGGENVLRSARWRAGEGTPVFRPAPRPAGPRSAYRQPRKSARTAWNAGLRPASRPDRAANGTNRKQRDGPYCDACFNRKGGAGVGDPATRRYAVPPACGGRCRPEVGVPCPGRASGNPALRRSLRFAQRCRSEGPHRENWPAFPALAALDADRRFPPLSPPRSRRASRTRPPTAWSPLPTPDHRAAAE